MADSATMEPFGTQVQNNVSIDRTSVDFLLSPENMVSSGEGDSRHHVPPPPPPPVAAFVPSVQCSADLNGSINNSVQFDSHTSGLDVQDKSFFSDRKRPSESLDVSATDFNASLSKNAKVDILAAACQAAGIEGLGEEFTTVDMSALNNMMFDPSVPERPSYKPQQKVISQYSDGLYSTMDNTLNQSLQSGSSSNNRSSGSTPGGNKKERRKRCGMCGPCQVTTDCGDCQYCLNKKTLKQACAMRQCEYLRSNKGKRMPSQFAPGHHTSDSPTRQNTASPGYHTSNPIVTQSGNINGGLPAMALGQIPSQTSHLVTVVQQDDVDRIQQHSSSQPQSVIPLQAYSAGVRQIVSPGNTFVAPIASSCNSSSGLPWAWSTAATSGQQPVIIAAACTQPQSGGTIVSPVQQQYVALPSGTPTSFVLSHPQPVVISSNGSNNVSLSNWIGQSQALQSQK